MTRLELAAWRIERSAHRVGLVLAFGALGLVALGGVGFALGVKLGTL